MNCFFNSSCKNANISFEQVKSFEVISSLGLVKQVSLPSPVLVINFCSETSEEPERNKRIANGGVGGRSALQLNNKVVCVCAMRETSSEELKDGEATASLTDYCGCLGRRSHACYFRPHLSVPIRQAIHQRRMGS